jgi:NAD-dependent dihydropyrimidine dehydrogenase PreA subunit
MIHNRSTRRNRTRFIELDTHLCKACWDCIDACQQDVIGKIGLPFHRHAGIKNAANCKGCKKCVLACRAGALRYIYTGPL